MQNCFFPRHWVSNEYFRVGTSCIYLSFIQRSLDITLLATEQEIIDGVFPATRQRNPVFEGDAVAVPFTTDKHFLTAIITFEPNHQVNPEQALNFHMGNIAWIRVAVVFHIPYTAVARPSHEPVYNNLTWQAGFVEYTRLPVADTFHTTLQLAGIKRVFGFQSVTFTIFRESFPNFTIGNIAITAKFLVQKISTEMPAGSFFHKRAFFTRPGFAGGRLAGVRTPSSEWRTSHEAVVITK